MRLHYFLCHNHKDRPSILPIRRMFEDAGIPTLLDEQDTPLGVPWYPYIFDHMDDLAGAVVFLGPHGLGPIQEQEIEHILRRFELLGKPVIPVLLPGFHEERPELPKYVSTQLWGKWNYVDLSLDPPASLRKLVGQLLPRAPIDDTHLVRTARAIPRIQVHKSVDLSFKASWIALHVLGYLAIVAVVQSKSHLDHPRAMAAAATFAVWALLVLSGRRVLRTRSIRPDYRGVFFGTAAATLGSILLVSQASSPDGLVRAIGALATTVATGGLAGAAAGWLAGVAMATLASVAAFAAAALVPTNPVRLQDHIQGVDSEIAIGLIGGAVGAAIWGFVLSSMLLVLAKEHIRFRSLFSSGE